MVRYLERRVKGISRFMHRVVKSFSAHECPKHAAAISYYTLFSIFPLLLLLVYIASFFFPSEESRLVLSEYLHNIIPYGVENFNEILDQTWSARSSMGLVSAIWLLWGGSSFFNAVVTSLNHIWETSPRTYLQRRALAIVVVIILVISFIASFIIGPVTTILLDRTGSGRQVFSYLFELFSVTVILLLIYRIFPNRTVEWNAAFAGALSAGSLVQNFVKIFDTIGDDVMEIFR
ncbi:MAG: YihY/virulence factor BrkB family protein, partial [Anaerolineales bacterium]